MEQKIIAAGVFPICYKTGRVLLSRRPPHVMYGDTWASWGGKFEDELGDDSPQGCAKREFWEETKISVPYTFMEEPIHVYEDERVIYYTFLGFFDQEPEVDVTEGGLAGYQWFSLNELPEPLMPEFKIMLEQELERIKWIMKGLSLSLEEPMVHYQLVSSGVVAKEVDITVAPITSKITVKSILNHGK